MPLTRISLIKGKSPEHIRAISDGVHRGLIDAYGVPADDRFQLIHQHARDELVYDAAYLGLRRTDDIVIITIVAGNWRDMAQKKALYRAITDNLVASPGLRPEDVIVVLSPNARDDWSFGNGLPSYVADDAA
ncbi:MULTISPECIES: tautomerase family protein [Methylobacterium]|uniref:tautomerase family protein n=1 Tax=Methylobacterium TaxID=407 RepID=UPI0013ECB7CE|nr:tautomerase family protein [Methylobacterium sp. DB0501]NGM35170.1 tautomerase family protein [Methylobacterium sp. DB0501]